VLSLVKLLSDREREVFELLASLETNAEIAETLVVSTNTVKYHLKNIYNKLGAEGRDEVIALAQQVVRQQKRVGRIPQQVDRFVGRKRELKMITRLLLESENRLVTLTGIGGVGKTRLAIEIAHRLSEDFTDGIYFVNLIQKHSPEALLSAICDVLGLVNYPHGASIRNEVMDFLRDSSALLIFDNLGDVRDAAPLVVELLEYCSDLHLLVTSRERLHISTETVFQLDGISIDDADANSQSEAVELFIEAAKRVKPDFILHDDDLSAIKEICTFANGLPLAIIIAASWVSSLPIPDIPQELKTDLSLLEIDYQDLPPRHRSILELFHRQLNHLDPDLQEKIACMTVFVSGFARDAASKIADVSLASLRKLKELSFLTYDDATDLYHFHPLIRQFVENYALRGKNLSSVVEQHSQYYAQLLLSEMESIKGISRLPNSLENILSGWQWACEHQQEELLNQYLVGLYVYGYKYGWSRFGAKEQQTFERILQVQDGSLRDNHGYAYLCLASLHQYHGQSALAMACVRAGIELNSEQPLTRVLFARLLLLRSSLFLGRREFASTLRTLNELEQVLATPNNQLEWRLWIDMQLSRCYCYYWQNDLHNFSICIDELEPKVEQFGDWVQQADLWHRKSTLDFRLHGSNTSAKAIEYSKRSLKICQRIGSPNWVMQRKFSLGFLYLWAGQLDMAEDYLLQAKTEGDYLGLRDYLRYPYVYLSILYRFRDDIEKVKVYTDILKQQANDLMDKVYLGIVAANLAWIANKEDDLDRCVQHAEDALNLWEDIAYPMQWLACFPMIVALHELERYDQIPQYIHRVLKKDQQSLPDTLRQYLEAILQIAETSNAHIADEVHNVIHRINHYLPQSNL
jgi:DNA-binding CsgD family transcriptional regulator